MRQAVRKLMDSLSDEQKELFFEYESEENARKDCVEKGLFEAGFKSGVHLMNSLGKI